MSVFFYFRTGGKAGHHHESVSAFADRYNVDRMIVENDVAAASGAAKSTSQLDLMLTEITAGDTLVVARLIDLGLDINDICRALKILQTRMVRVIVDEIGSIDIAARDDNIVIKTLDALTGLPRPTAKPAADKANDCKKAHAYTDIEKYRVAIITDYSLGISLASLARKYGVSRSRIARLVSPDLQPDTYLPTAFGD